MTKEQEIRLVTTGLRELAKSAETTSNTQVLLNVFDRYINLTNALIILLEDRDERT